MPNNFQIILHQIFFFLLCLSTIKANQNINSKTKLDINKDLDLAHIRVVRQPGCNPTNRIKYCNEDTGKYPVPVSKRVLQKFISVLEISKDCNYDSIKYSWKLTKKRGYPQEFDEDTNVLKIQPFTLRNNKKYKIISTVQPARGGLEVSAITAECNFEVNPETPIVIISGRDNYSVPIGSDVKLQSLSIDRDVPKNQTGNLEHSWKCEYSKFSAPTQKINCGDGMEKEFIPDLSTQTEKGICYIELKVKPLDSTEWSTAKTILYNLPEVTEVLIECETNCPPTTFPSLVSALTTVTANCIQNCGKIAGDSYEWTVENDPTFNYETFTQTGRNQYKFSALPHAFRDGQSYTLSVVVKDNPGSFAKIVLHFQAPPRIDSCSVIPPTGTAIKDQFSLQCKLTGDIVELSVFTQKDHNSMVLAKGPTADDLKFFLAVDAVPFLKITDKNSLTHIRKLDVRVNPLIQSSNPESMVKDIMDVVKKLPQKEGEEVVQILSGVVEELHNAQDQIGELFEPTRQKLLDTISKVNSGQLTPEESMAIASITSRLNEKSEGKPHAESGVISSEICKNAAEMNMEQLQQEQFPGNLANETRNKTQSLMACQEHDVAENKALEKSPNISVPTTPFPLLPEKVITEDYPNYMDDDTETREQMYKVATDNFINICRANVKSLVMTTQPSDKVVTVLTKTCEVAVTRKLGSELIFKTIETNDTIIKPSDDFGKYPDDIIDVMICTWGNKLFWWKPNSRLIVSKVIYLKFSMNGTKISKFTSPIQLIFKTKQTNPNFKIHTVKFPEAGGEKFEKDQDMAIIRVDAKALQSFFVEFIGLAAGDLYDVIISDNRKIRIENFKTQAKKVSQQRNVLFEDHNHDSDGWHYISVIQNKAMGAFKPEFKISVYTVSCFSWSDEQQAWITSCQGTPESSVEQIVCKCWHLSILAGAAYNNTIKIDHFVIDPDFTLDLVSNSILIITVIASFALYCAILAICFRERKVLGNSVYVLTDLIEENKYKYFVEVNTGGRWRSGTSSNICMRIYGTKDKTKSHLVNYPDPEKRILQKNNCDWFLLTTKHSLGEIVSIAIWSDCSGRQPSWFCKDITVFDLQTEKNWYFLVEEWIRLPPKGKYFVRVKPVVREVNVFKRFLKWIRRGDWNFVIVSNLSAFKLCTIVLSTFLTIYVLTLFLYGIPHLQLSDAFISVSELKLNFQVFLNGFITSIVSFLVHFCVIWVFRQEAENNTNSKFFKLTKISWIFLAVNISISTMILVIFGFWLPEIKAWFWLTSIIEAIILYFLFLQLVSKIYSIFFAQSKKKIDYEFESMKTMAALMQDQLNHLHYKFGETILRPYIHYVYKLLDKEVIAKKKKYYAARTKLLILVEDIVMFTVYLTLLFLTIFANQDSLAVKGHESMLDLVTGTLAQTAALEDVTDIDSFYTYVNETLINALHSPQWYSKYIVDEPGMMIDFTNKYLGVARFRQLRVIPNKNCKIPEIMEEFYVNDSCRSKFSLGSGDWSGFGQPKYKTHRLATIWNYTKTSTAGSLVVFGKFSVYPGGGYISTLGRTMYNSLVNLAYMQDHNWLDKYTRVVFIEFLTYSVNSNLFNAVRITFEKGASGYILVSAYVNTRKMLFAEGERRRTENIINIAFLIVVMILTIKVFLRIFNSDRKIINFWKDLWILIDLSLVAMSYACVALFVHRMHLIQEFLEATEKAKKNEFVHYFDFFNEDFLFMMVAAFLVFVATIRLWKLVRFGQVFKVMEKTIVLSFGSLMILFMNHAIVILAFAMSGRVILGDKEKEFKDVTRTVITLSHFCLGMFGDFDFSQFQQESGFFGPLHYSLYMISSLAFCTMYEAILMSAYNEAKVSLSNDDEFDVVTTFLYNEYRYYRKFFRGKLKRLRGGTISNEEKSPHVTPKEDVHRYANATTISKHQINVMKEVVKYRLLEDEVEEKQNLRQMIKILKTYFEDVNEEENEMFFCGKLPNNRIRLVHDDRLLKMERIVGILLSGKGAAAVQKQQNKKIARIVAKTETIKEIIDSMNVLIGNITII